MSGFSVLTTAASASWSPWPSTTVLATVSKGDIPYHMDREVADLQIAEMKNFVARHNDFMEIASDPVQLREIVRRDKLAVILGTEIDDIGDLVGKTPMSSLTR